MNVKPSGEFFDRVVVVDLGIFLTSRIRDDPGLCKKNADRREPDSSDAVAREVR
jgi:hypothetical protein